MSTKLIKFNFKGSSFELTPMMLAHFIKLDKMCRDNAFEKNGCCDCSDVGMDYCVKFSDCINQFRLIDESIVESLLKDNILE